MSNEITPEVLDKIYKKVRELTKEVQTLYELNEAEMVLLTDMMWKLPQYSPKTTAKLLKAAAMFIERNEEIAQEVIKGMKNG